jgi:hypothetical protein
MLLARRLALRKRSALNAVHSQMEPAVRGISRGGMKPS